MEPWQGTARELFESAREANADNERIKAQLQRMEQDAQGLGGPSFGPHVSGTRDPDRMARRVGAYVDLERILEDRLERNYELIDYATAVLYGADTENGLSVSLGREYADILWWRYCARACWDVVSQKVFYCVRKCQYMHNRAM